MEASRRTGYTVCCAWHAGMQCVAWCMLRGAWCCTRPVEGVHMKRGCCAGATNHECIGRSGCRWKEFEQVLATERAAEARNWSS